MCVPKSRMNQSDVNQMILKESVRSRNSSFAAVPRIGSKRCPFVICVFGGRPIGFEAGPPQHRFEKSQDINLLGKDAKDTQLACKGKRFVFLAFLRTYRAKRRVCMLGRLILMLVGVSYHAGVCPLTALTELHSRSRKLRIMVSYIYCSKTSLF